MLEVIIRRREAHDEEDDGCGGYDHCYKDYNGYDHYQDYQDYNRGQDEDNDGIVGCDHCYGDYNRGQNEHGDELTYDAGNNCDEEFLASCVGGKHDYIIIFIIYIIILPEEE